MIAAPYFEQIESARTPSDLFEDADRARSVYRRLARYVHPDTNNNDPRAHSAFERLVDLWDEYNGKTRNTSSPKPSGLVYETKRGVYAVNGRIARGDVSNVYRVEYQTGDDILRGALKMPRNPANNDLVVNEINALKLLKEQVPEKYRMFHPHTVDSFAHRDKNTGKTRRSVILEELEGFVSLRDVAQAYPSGIDPKHVAWIARRVWVAVDTAHAAGLVHGAIFPEHVMIHPTLHGVVLVDWSYSQAKGEKLKAAVPSYQKLGWYGTAFDKPLDHRLDIRQASHTLEMMLGDHDARPFRAFFNGCRVASTPTAGELYEEFEDLLTQVYGARKYIPFEMPKGWKRAD